MRRGRSQTVFVFVFVFVFIFFSRTGCLLCLRAQVPKCVCILQAMWDLQGDLEYLLLLDPKEKSDK